MGPHRLAEIIGKLVKPKIWSLKGERRLAKAFRYISRNQLEYRHGLRHAYMGEVPAPVVYGMQGNLREYYGVSEGVPMASTLDHIVAAVGG